MRGAKVYFAPGPGCVPGAGKGREYKKNKKIKKVISLCDSGSGRLTK